MVAGQVGGNSRQPGAKFILLPQAIDVLESPDERLLGDVFGALPVAR